MLSGLAVGALLAACAMSESAYARLAASVRAENEQRDRAVAHELRRRGWLQVDDDTVRWAILPEEARERCMHRANRADAKAARGQDPAEVATLRLIEPSRGGESPAPVEVSAPMPEVCTFFDRSAGELLVTKSDGAEGTLVRVEAPRALARNAKGEIVEIDLQVRVHRRRVLVKRSCNRMPMVAPSPIERRDPLMVVWGRRPPLRTITLSVEREELDIECTDNVY